MMRFWSASLMALALAFVVLGDTSSSRAEALEDLFGTWEGVWYVDEKFDSNGNPYGNPPYPSEDFTLILHEYGAGSESFGELLFSEYVDGMVSSLTLNQGNVEAILWYPALGTGYPATLTGVLSGKTIVGDFDEFVPPPAGWISFCGPIKMTLVTIPEPSAAVLLGWTALSASSLAWRCRRCRRSLTN